MAGGGSGSGAIPCTASGVIPRMVAVDRMATGDHACLGFDGDDDRWAVRAAFTTAGLARGERVLIFTDPGPARVVGAGATEALTRLAVHGVPAERCVRTGQLTVVTSSPGYDPARGSFDLGVRTAFWVAGAADARRRGFTGVRAVADMTWAARAGLSGPELAAYETGLAPHFARLGLTGICEYDRRVFPASLLAEVAAAHPLSVLPSVDALHAARDGAVLRLTGSADLATRTAFDLALRDAFATAPPAAVLDLTGLSFLDAHCARTVLRLASARRPPGTTVRCTAAQYRVLRICGAADTDAVLFRISA